MGVRQVPQGTVPPPRLWWLQRLQEVMMGVATLHRRGKIHLKGEMCFLVPATPLVRLLQSSLPPLS